MNKAFIETLYKTLVMNNDYSPITDENGEIFYGDGIKVLVKNRSGAFVLLELINGDLLTTEKIEMHLQEAKSKLTSMEFAEIHYIAQLYVFSKEPDPAKVDAININQIHESTDRKLLKCMSVHLNDKEFNKYFTSSANIFGLDKTIKSLFQSSNYENVSYNEVKEILKQREKDYTLELKANKPIITYSLLAINILVWLAVNAYALKSGLDVNKFQVNLGAKININIINGEYWRFLTPIFLHSGIVHLVLNCYSLYAVGVTVERIFGHLKYITIYLIAGILGNVLSFMFSPTAAVGASGSIFGLLGAILYFGLEKPKIFKTYFGANIFTVIAVNLAYGFSNARIDNFGHIGGLIGGFLTSGIVKATNISRWYLNRALFIGLTLVLTSTGIFYGFNSKQNSILKMVNTLEQYATASNWTEAEKTAEEILLNNPDKRTTIGVYWTLIASEELSEKFNEAIDHAKEVQKIEPKVGNYLLGRVYYDIGQYDNSKQELLKAKELGSEYDIADDINELLNKINSIKQSQ